jgi:hypothetical protein
MFWPQQQPENEASATRPAAMQSIRFMGSSLTEVKCGNFKRASESAGEIPHRVKRRKRSFPGALGGRRLPVGRLAACSRRNFVHDRNVTLPSSRSSGRQSISRVRQASGLLFTSLEFTVRIRAICVAFALRSPHPAMVGTFSMD